MGIQYSHKKEELSGIIRKISETDLITFYTPLSYYPYNL